MIENCRVAGLTFVRFDHAEGVKCNGRGHRPRITPRKNHGALKGHNTIDEAKYLLVPRSLVIKGMRPGPLAQAFT